MARPLRKQRGHFQTMKEDRKFGVDALPTERERISLNIINSRMGRLIRQYDEQKNQPLQASIILEELSQLAVVRDELKSISAKVNSTEQPPGSLPPEFPTVGTFFQRLNTFACQIAKTPRENPHRPELLNEFTRLCLVAGSLYKTKIVFNKCV
jgi:hypothetical protein